MRKASPNNLRRSCLFAAGLASLALAAFAPSALARNIYTANYNEGTVSVIESQTSQVVGSPIPVGPEVYDLAVTPDGRTVYALISPGSVIAINAQTNQVIGSPIPVGSGPTEIAIAPDGKHAYVVNSNVSTVSVIDTQANAVVGSPISLPLGPYAIAITPDGKFAYVTSAEENIVSVVDLQTNQVVGSPIPVGETPTGIAMTPDGKTAYVVNEESATVSVIDLQTNQVVGPPIPVGLEPYGLAIAPDGKTAYVVNISSGNVSVIDLQTNQVVGSPIPVGERPFSVAFTPDGKFAYVANYKSENVTVIDAQTRQAVGAPIPVGGGPWQVAIIPDQGPAASFTAGVPSFGVPLAFNGSASSDPDGSIARYDWSFGDGGTALNAGSLVTHTYRAAGIYQPMLTVTDNEGCSTKLIFTGQTAYCNGLAAAAITQAITVPRPSNAFKFGKVKRNHRNGTARLQIKVPDAGVLILVGKQVRRVKRRATKAGVVILTVRPKVKLNKALKRRHHAKVKVKVTFTPTGGTARTESKALKLIRP